MKIIVYRVIGIFLLSVVHPNINLIPMQPTAQDTWIKEATATLLKLSKPTKGSIELLRKELAQYPNTNSCICNDFDDEALTCLVTTYENQLQALSFWTNNACGITSGGIRALCKNQPNLTQLYLPESSLGDDDIAHIAEGLPQLTELDCSSCPEVTQKSLACFPKLTKLRHVSTAYSGICPDSFIDFICCHPHITSFDFPNNKAVTNDHLARLARERHNLVSFTLHGNELVTDTGLIPIATACTELATVYIADCPNISDSTIVALAANRSITNAMLIGLTISDDAFSAFVTTHPHLENLSILWCNKLTSKAYQAITEHCRSLKWFQYSLLPEAQEVSVPKDVIIALKAAIEAIKERNPECVFDEH